MGRGLRTLLIAGFGTLAWGCTSIELPELKWPTMGSTHPSQKPSLGRTAVIGVGFMPEVAVVVPNAYRPKEGNAPAQGAAGGAVIACGPFAAAGSLPVIGVGLLAICAVAVVPAMAFGAVANTLAKGLQSQPELSQPKLPPNELLPTLVASELGLRAIDVPLRMKPTDTADYETLAGQLDSVLEVSVRRILGDPGVDPDVVIITVEADMRLVGPHGVQLIQRAYTEKSDFIVPRDADAAAAAASSALAATYSALAREIGKDARNLGVSGA